MIRLEPRLWVDLYNVIVAFLRHTHGYIGSHYSSKNKKQMLSADEISELCGVCAKTYSSRYRCFKQSELDLCINVFNKLF